VKGFLRFVTNGVAVFLALYLIDSVVPQDLVVKSVWAAVIIGIVLGFVNSLARPLPRARSKPLYAGVAALLTLLVNALVLQLMAWAGALEVLNAGVVFVAAAFLALVTGTISWLIGFGRSGKTRPLTVEREEGCSNRDRRSSLPRSGHERLE
jgi:uncharacterized membrane protein YvlD (DUF360 family)